MPPTMVAPRIAAFVNPLCTTTGLWFLVSNDIFIQANLLNILKIRIMKAEMKWLFCEKWSPSADCTCFPLYNFFFSERNSSGP